MKIIHRCAVCHYPEEYHPHVEYNRRCHVPVDVIKQQPPEVIVTLDGKGVPVETVTEPGTAWVRGIDACGCDNCVKIFEEMMGS